MSDKKRKIAWGVGVGVFVAAVLAGGIYLIVSFLGNLAGNSEQPETPTVVEEPFDTNKYDGRVELGSLPTEKSDQAAERLKSALKPEMEITERSMIQFMHHLTHQKVRAGAKWISIQMTPEVIDLVIQVIDKKGTAWVRKEQLMKIAQKWQKGDFSEADEDHNFLWRLLDGNIGEASRVLSEEEEAQYIEETFKGGSSHE